MLSFANLLVPAILFFSLGFIAQLMRSDLEFPPSLSKTLAIYLMIGIGLHGGIELRSVNLAMAIQAILWAVLLGISLPLIAYVILYNFGKMDKLNAAAIAAHYGSVSFGTFLTAIAFLKELHVTYETYPIIMLAIMETPAIFVGLILARYSSKNSSIKTLDKQQKVRPVVLDILSNGSVIVLLGSMVIGYLALFDGLKAIKPFYTDIFGGVLCLFLLNMGFEAAKNIHEFYKVGFFLVAFGVFMPLLGGLIGAWVGHSFLGFGVGGSTLVAVLSASSSYIAVPPAIKLAIPEANPTYYLTLSLGITFPFNIIIGIPLYYKISCLLAGC